MPNDFTRKMRAHTLVDTAIIVMTVKATATAVTVGPCDSAAMMEMGYLYCERVFANTNFSSSSPIDP